MRISDWSSDVCSSDLFEDHARSHRIHAIDLRRIGHLAQKVRGITRDRKSVVSGKSVSVRVDLGGRRIITTKNPHLAHTPVYTPTLHYPHRHTINHPVCIGIPNPPTPVSISPIT